MQRRRSFQLSLRGLMGLTAFVAACLSMALWYAGQFTPPHGQTLVTRGEQRVLSEIERQLGVVFADRSPYC